MASFIVRPFTVVALEGLIESLTNLASEGGLSKPQLAMAKRLRAKAALRLFGNERISYRDLSALSAEVEALNREVKPTA